MRRIGAFIGVVIVIFLILLISGAFYTVREWEQVVITQFGRPIGKPKTEAGLRFKIPFIQKLHPYEKRVLRWDGDPKEIPTRDKRFIYVDTTARWRIVDGQKFLEVTGTYNQAYAKLDDIIDAVLRDYVSSNPLVELVRTTNEMPTVEEGEGQKAEILGEMDKELKSIISGAYRTAEEIRGEADAEATRIYGDAYNQDPAFYAFFKTLETYKEAAHKNAFVILGTDSDYYRFLKTVPK